MALLKLKSFLGKVFRVVSSLIIYPIVHLISIPKLIRLERDSDTSAVLALCNEETSRTTELLFLRYNMTFQLHKVLVKLTFGGGAAAFTLIICAIASNADTLITSLPTVGIYSLFLIPVALESITDRIAYLNAVDQLLLPLKTLFRIKNTKSLLSENTSILNEIRKGNHKRVQELLEGDSQRLPNHVLELRSFPSKIKTEIKLHLFCKFRLPGLLYHSA